MHRLAMETPTGSLINSQSNSPCFRNTECETVLPPPPSGAASGSNGVTDEGRPSGLSGEQRKSSSAQGGRRKSSESSARWRRGHRNTSSPGDGVRVDTDTATPSLPSLPDSTQQAKRTTKFKSKAPVKSRPTHFLALPLHNHPGLCSRIASFQAALFTDPGTPTQVQIAPSRENPKSSKNKGKGKVKSVSSPIVRGLDSSIVIDPRRMHITLGVMSLEPDDHEAPGPGPITAAEILATLPDSGQTSGLGFAILDTTKGTSAPISPPHNLEPRSADAGADVSKNEAQRTPTSQRKTPTIALALLRSLAPRITQILGDSHGVQVPLEEIDVFGAARMKPPFEVTRTSDIVARVQSTEEDGKEDVPHTKVEEIQGEKLALSERPVEKNGEEGSIEARVLFVGPRPIDLRREADADRRKLQQVCDLVHRTFRDAGCITDTRPLKLHCTLLNTSHRKPASHRRLTPFSYSDILRATDACSILGMGGLAGLEPTQSFLKTNQAIVPDASRVSDAGTVGEPEHGRGSAVAPPKPTAFRAPPPLSVELGTYTVNEIQLWVMGSHTPEGEYVNCGGVALGGSSDIEAEH